MRRTSPIGVLKALTGLPLLELVVQGEVRSVAYREGGFGCSNRPRNSEDIGGVLDRISKKNRHLDFLL